MENECGYTWEELGVSTEEDKAMCFALWQDPFLKQAGTSLWGYKSKEEILKWIDTKEVTHIAWIKRTI